MLATSPGNMAEIKRRDVRAIPIAVPKNVKKTPIFYT